MSAINEHQSTQVHKNAFYDNTKRVNTHLESKHWMRSLANGGHAMQLNFNILTRVTIFTTKIPRT